MSLASVSCPAAAMISAVSLTRLSGRRRTGSIPMTAQLSRQPAVRIGQQEKTGDHRDEPARVKQAVRHQPDGQRGLVVEVMPVQQLVEDRLVDERHQAYP